MHNTCAVLRYHLGACPPVQYFSTLSHKRHDFKDKDFELGMCVLIFSPILSETFLILRRIERDIMQNVCWSSCE